MGKIGLITNSVKFGLGNDCMNGSIPDAFKVAEPVDEPEPLLAGVDVDEPEPLLAGVDVGVIVMRNLAAAQLDYGFCQESQYHNSYYYNPYNHIPTVYGSIIGVQSLCLQCSK